MGKDIQKVDTPGMEVVDRYKDLVPVATNGVVGLERAMEKFAREHGKTFEEAFLERSLELADGDMKGSLAGLAKIFDKRVPDLKSTELKVGSMGQAERSELARELARGIVV